MHRSVPGMARASAPYELLERTIRSYARSQLGNDLSKLTLIDARIIQAILAQAGYFEPIHKIRAVARCQMRRSKHTE